MLSPESVNKLSRFRAAQYRKYFPFFNLRDEMGGKVRGGDRCFQKPANSGYVKFDYVGFTYLLVVFGRDVRLMLQRVLLLRNLGVCHNSRSSS